MASRPGCLPPLAGPEQALNLRERDHHVLSAGSSDHPAPARLVDPSGDHVQAAKFRVLLPAEELQPPPPRVRVSLRQCTVLELDRGGGTETPPLGTVGDGPQALKPLRRVRRPTRCEGRPDLSGLGRDRGRLVVPEEGLEDHAHVPVHGGDKGRHPVKVDVHGGRRHQTVAADHAHDIADHVPVDEPPSDLTANTIPGPEHGKPGQLGGAGGQGEDSASGVVSQGPAASDEPAPVHGAATGRGRHQHTRRPPVAAGNTGAVAEGVEHNPAHGPVPVPTNASEETPRSSAAPDHRMRVGAEPTSPGRTLPPRADLLEHVPDVALDDQDMLIHPGGPGDERPIGKSARDLPAHLGVPQRLPVVGDARALGGRDGSLQDSAHGDHNHFVVWPADRQVHAVLDVGLPHQSTPGLGDSNVINTLAMSPAGGRPGVSITRVRDERARHEQAVLQHQAVEALAWQVLGRRVDVAHRLRGDTAQLGIGIREDHRVAAAAAAPE